MWNAFGQQDDFSIDQYYEIRNSILEIIIY